MQIRPGNRSDVDQIEEIDGTIDSANYLHVERSGEGVQIGWRTETRPRREKLIAPNRLDDDLRFTLKQIVSGALDGTVLVAEHDGALVALAIAQPRPEFGTVQLLDVRVDYEFRRQGIATGMVYQIIQAAREQEQRAVAAEVRTDNDPANQMLLKLGFELAGIDTRRRSNHDLIKEASTLLWYAALD